MQRSERGFTLVELMVTVAVIAVILVIGVPGIANMKRNSDLTTTARELTVALNYARAEAVRQGIDVVVVSGAGTASTNFTSDGWAIRPVNADGTLGAVIRTFDTPPAGSSVALSVGTAPLTFESLGNASVASCFDITVSGSSAVRSLPIAAAGRVTTCRASCAVIGGDPTKCD